MEKRKTNILKEKFFNIKTLLAFVASFAIIYFLLTKLDFNELLKILKNANIFYILLSLIIYFTVFPILALRWQILLKNVGLKKKLKDLNEIIMMQWFANCIVPAKLGDLYKGYLMRKNYNFPISKTLGTIFVERFIDIVFLSILMIISVYVSFSGKFPPIIITPLKILVILILILIIAIFVMSKKKRKIKKMLPENIKRIFHLFERGVSKSLRLKDVPLVGFYSFMQWFTQIIVVYFIALAINLKISFSLVMFITLASALVTAIPLTPAGLGLSELTIAGILVMFDIEKTMAISAALLIRVITYGCLLVVGGIVYALSSKK